MPLRVIQWTTGNVGRAALRAVARHPDLELAGVYAYSADKVGKDAAELGRLPEPTGVLATDDIDALLALAPDACVYTPVSPDLEHMARILRAGVNLCSSSAFLNGRGLGRGGIPGFRGDAVAVLEEAALAGGATAFGAGMNPGYADLLGLVGTHVCSRVDQIRVLESVNTAAYQSAEGQSFAGMGHAIDEPGLVEFVGGASAVFEDAVEVMAAALRVELDKITFEADFTATTEDEDFGYMVLPAGSVGATDARWRGWVDGRDVIVLRVQWVMGNHLATPIELKHGYVVEIDGDPCVSLQLGILPAKDFDWANDDPMSIGMGLTANPVVNAIPHVVAAPPGIATYATLPLIAGPVLRGDRVLG